jgi:hypothetical protein
LLTQERSLLKYGSKKTKTVVPESVEILKIENEIRKEHETLDGRFDSLNGLGRTDLSKKPDIIELDVVETNSSRVSPSKPLISTISPAKQTETVTKDGKKRIRPILVENNFSESANFAVGGTSMLKQSPAVIGPKRARLAAVENQVADLELKGVQYVMPIVIAKDDHPCLQVPKPRSLFTIQTRSELSDRLDIFEFKNLATGSSSNITATQGNQVIWTLEYGAALILAAKGADFLAVAYADSTIHVVSTATGRR